MRSIYVAFVFAGGIEKRDGSEVILDESILKRSLNYRLIARGLAYPTYYNENVQRVIKNAVRWAHNPYARKITVGWTQSLEK